MWKWVNIKALFWAGVFDGLIVTVFVSSVVIFRVLSLTFTLYRSVQFSGILISGFSSVFTCSNNTVVVFLQYLISFNPTDPVLLEFWLVCNGNSVFLVLFLCISVTDNALTCFNCTLHHRVQSSVPRGRSRFFFFHHVQHTWAR